MSGPGPLRYQPAPNELAYYDGLFAVADRQRTGSIGGQEAVSFLSLSKIPIPVLKQLWSMADHTKTNTLNKQAFYAAVRLIQLYQNQEKPNPNASGDLAHVLSGKTPDQMRPAIFEGISGTRVPLPGQGAPPPQPQQPSPAPQQITPIRPVMPANSSQRSMPPPSPTPQRSMPPPSPTPSQEHRLTVDSYVMTPQDRQRYDGLFPNFKKQDGYVYGPEAVTLFSKSGMDTAALRQIWAMADVPVDNRLDALEFAIAMHLIVCCTKKGLSLPEKLPPSLAGLKQPQQASAIQQPPKQEQQLQQRTSFTSPGPNPMRSPNPSVAPMTSPHPMRSPNPSVAAMAPPLQHQQSLRSSLMPQRSGNMQQFTPVSASMVGSPVPQQQHLSTSNLVSGLGGVSISDAFSGMDALPQQPSLGIGGAGDSMRGLGNVSATGSFVGSGMASGWQNQSRSEVSSMGAGITSPTRLTMSQMQLPNNEPPTEISLSEHDPVKKTTSFESASESLMAPSMQHTSQQQYSISQPLSNSLSISQAAISNSTVEKGKSTQEIASKELAALQGVLQQLRAENISLKAQLSSFSEDEVQVRLDIEKTCKEIALLNNELTTLREDVAKAQASLIGATAELKTMREKKATLHNWVSDSKDVLLSLHESQSAVKSEAASITAQSKTLPNNATPVRSTATPIRSNSTPVQFTAAPAPQPKEAMEDSLFGDYSAPVLAPPATYNTQAYSSHVSMNPHMGNPDDLWGGSIDVSNHDNSVKQKDESTKSSISNHGTMPMDFTGMHQPLAAQQRQASALSGITTEDSQNAIGLLAPEEYQTASRQPTVQGNSAFSMMDAVPPTSLSGPPTILTPSNNEYSLSKGPYAEQLQRAKAAARETADKLAIAEAAQVQFMQQAEQLELEAIQAEKEANEMQELKANKKKGVFGKSKKSDVSLHDNGCE